MAKTNLDNLYPGDDRDLYSGLIRLHVLHHACQEPVFGLGMIEELARHGYRISPGSLYPLPRRSFGVQSDFCRRQVFQRTNLL